MVVRKDRAAHSRKCGVAAYEISRHEVYEVEQLFYGLAVHFHGHMLGINGYTVLIEVSVGAELPKPLLAAEFHGCEAKRLFVARTV